MTQEPAAPTLREAFEQWFQAVELGDGDVPLPTSPGKRWDEYVERHQLALGAWEACRAALAARPADPVEPTDMLAVCAALGFDPTNHHNAAKCPYCRPATPAEPSV